MAITIHQESQESKENDNGMEESLIDNMPLRSEIKGDDIEEKEEILASAPFDTDQEREPFSLPSLYKATNPYRPPIPLTCHPQKADNDKKPLKLKDPESFMVNITIGGKKIIHAMLDLGEIMPYSVYLRLGLSKLKSTPKTLQLVDKSIKHPKGFMEDLLVQVDKFKVPMDFTVLEMK